MSKLFFIPVIALLFLGCTSYSQDKYLIANCTDLLDSYGNLEILSELIDPAKNEYDVDIVRLWSRDTETKSMNILFQTMRSPELSSWYLTDGNRFIPIPYDSIPMASFVKIWREKPLQLIVSGCPDMRNIYSFFIDVNANKAWFIPSNSGFIGETEEGYMIFSSYRYVKDAEIGGRYTFLQIFNESGEMVDSLSLEHHHY